MASYGGTNDSSIRDPAVVLQARGAQVVLDRHGHAGERQGGEPRPIGVEPARRVERAIGADGDVGVDARLGAGDGVERGATRVGGRQSAGANGVPYLEGGEAA